MNKYLFLTFLFLTITIVGCANQEPSASIPDHAIGAVVSETNFAISRNEISSHMDEADCWIVFSGGVYDITGYLQTVDGDDDITRVSAHCGTTTPFETVVDSENIKFSGIEARSIYVGEFNG